MCNGSARPGTARARTRHGLLVGPSVPPGRAAPILRAWSTAKAGTTGCFPCPGRPEKHDKSSRLGRPMAHFSKGRGREDEGCRCRGRCGPCLVALEAMTMSGSARSKEMGKGTEEAERPDRMWWRRPPVSSPPEPLTLDLARRSSRQR